MTVHDLFLSVTREIPEAAPRDFLKLVNDEVERLCGAFRWSYYRTRTTFAMPEVYSNVTLVNGSATITIPGAYLQADILEGATLTITVAGTSYEYTVKSIINVITLELSSNWANATTSAATVSLPYRSDWRLPSNFRSLISVRGDSLSEPYQDPYHYTLGQRAFDGRQLLVWQKFHQPSGSDDIHLDYWRKEMPATGPTATIDIDDIMERPLYLGVIGRIITRARTGAIEDGMRARAEENARLYEQALRFARSQDIQRRRPVQVNAKVGLRVNPHV